MSYIRTLLIPLRKTEPVVKRVVKINGSTVRYNKGYTLMEVCDAVGIRVPRFCYTEQAVIAGNCRMCFVEMRASPKPLIACTCRAVPYMELFTESPLVKKAREGVLEFLLLNHPLDCPACDQGGECDLQEQSRTFGGDSGRGQFFAKRPVQDKNIGFFVKTIMSRCIHCTRCIRFLKNKAFSKRLGTIGRGENTEISFFFEKCYESSLLSGNVVDVCPVGALTNKGYAFQGRSWEVYEIRYSGIIDTLGLNLKISIQDNANKITKITPMFSRETGTKIITDFTRNCVSGILLDRIESAGFCSRKNLTPAALGIKKPQLSSGLLLKRSFIGSNVSYGAVLKTPLNFVFGPNTGLRDAFYLLLRTTEKGSSNFCHGSFLRTNVSSLYPFLYYLPYINRNKEYGIVTPSPSFVRSFLFSLFKQQVSPTIFFASMVKGRCFPLKELRYCSVSMGTDFTTEFPTLLSKVFTDHIKPSKNLVFGLFPYKSKSLFLNFKKGLSSSSFIDFVEGRSLLCKNVCKTKNYFVFFSMMLKRRFDGGFLHSFLNAISCLKQSSGVLSCIASETSNCELSTGKNTVLKELGFFNCGSDLSLTEGGTGTPGIGVAFFQGLYLINNVKKNAVVYVGEISEKTAVISRKQLAFIWVFLSSFNNKNSLFKKDSLIKSVLGKIVLPRTLFIEESFDFVSTLGQYKESFLFRPEGLQLKKLVLNEEFKTYKDDTKLLNYRLNDLLRFSERLLEGRAWFLFLYDSECVNKFPLYTTLGSVYLTELKALSRENFLREDILLHKSPVLTRFRTFLTKWYLNIV